MVGQKPLMCALFKVSSEASMKCGRNSTTGKSDQFKTFDNNYGLIVKYSQSNLLSDSSKLASPAFPGCYCRLHERLSTQTYNVSSLL